MDKFKKISVILFACLLLGLTVVDIVTPDRFLSETENKKLQQKPEINIENIFSGKFEKEYETYVSDQFLGRDSWVSQKTFFDKNLFFKKEINGIYFGKDNYLFEKHKDVKDKKKKLKKLQSFLEQHQNQVSVMIIPTSDNILSDKIPYMPILDEKELLEEIHSISGNSYIDMYSVMMSHKDEDIYYKTDHHWTTEGAYLGYLAFCEKMNLEPVPLKLETISADFLGTLHSRVNIPVKSDIIKKMEPEITLEKVVFDKNNKKDALFFPEHLETKNKYGYFLDNNHGLIEITTSNKNGKTLTILKDSYANCMVPMLVNHYENINIIDKRYFSNGFEKYIGENDDILILYNVISFFDNF